MTETGVTASDARAAVSDAIPAGESPRSATRIDAGTNAVFRVGATSGSFVVKFNTYSEFETVAAEVQVYRLLADADLPTPRVVDAALTPEESPAYFVMDALPGETPTDVTPSLAEQMGRYLHGFAELSDRPEGYGRLHYAPDASPPLAAAADSWREYVDGFVDHVLSKPSDRFTDLVEPVTAAVERTLPAVPRDPEPAVAFHDYRPANVHVDEDGDLVGIVDLERADLGDVRYTLVDAEYLLTRHRPAAAAERLRTALYDGFAAGSDAGGTPAGALRDCYRALAVAREIRAFDLWWAEDPAADEKAENVRRVARELTE